MGRGKIKNSGTYERGKQIIFVITLCFSIVGLIINLIFNFSNLSQSLKYNCYIGLGALTIIFVVNLFNNEKCNKLFLFMSWTMVFNILIGQFLALNSGFHELIFENLLLRNITFLIFYVVLTGFIAGLKHSFTQLIAMLLSLLYFALSNKTPYITKNAVLLLSMIIGFFLILAFFVNHLNSFIHRIHTQRNVLERRNKEIVDNITYAKRIQKAILPEQEDVTKNFKDSFIYYKPKDIVAGDFYWVEKKEDAILFAVADCTGHGVSGAMVSVVCNYGLNRSVKEYGITTPGLILDKTREFVLSKFEKDENGISDGMDIALCSLKGLKLEYAGAYRPLWIVRNNQIIEIKGDKQPIGIFYQTKEYFTHQIDLEEGDIIYLFSDGYIDQFGGERRKKLKTKPFQDLLLNIQSKTMKEQKTVLNDYIMKWKGDLEQVDDICIFGIRI